MQNKKRRLSYHERKRRRANRIALAAWLVFTVFFAVISYAIGGAFNVMLALAISGLLATRAIVEN